MKSSRRRQMLASVASRPTLAGAMSETLTISDEKINGVRATIRTIGDAVLTLKAGRLYEQLGSPRPLRCFAELLCAD